jgi:hypothetical protein
MNVELHLAPEVESQLRHNASTEGVTLDAYLDAVVARAARVLPDAGTTESAGGAGDEDCPWRGVFVLPRPRRDLFNETPELPAAELPRRPPTFNMNWHRASIDDE